MSRPLDDHKQVTIIKAAIEVFGKKGFSNTTIKDIADRAEVATGTVYTYFRDKEQLFELSVNAVWSDFFANMEKIFASATTLYSKLEKLIGFAMPLLKDLHPLVRGMFSQANRMDLVQVQLEALSNRMHLLFQESGYLQKITSEGSIDPKDIFRVWLAGFLFIISSVDENGLDAEIQKMTNFVTYMVGTLKSENSEQGVMQA